MLLCIDWASLVCPVVYRFGFALSFGLQSILIASLAVGSLTLRLYTCVR